MQVVVLLLLVASLALLVAGLITGGTPLVVASIVASLVAAYAISRHRGRQPAAVGAAGAAASESRGGAWRSGAAGLSAGVSQSGSAAGSRSEAAAGSRPEAAAPSSDGSPDVTEPVLAADLIARQARAQAEAGRAGEFAVAAPAGEHRADDAAGGASTESEPPAAAAAVNALPGTAASKAGVPGAVGSAVELSDAADPAMADTDPPLRSRGAEPVLVIDGRPRYHVSGCEFLTGRDAEPVPLRQAVEDGFTPCALCDPDSRLAAGTNPSQAGTGRPDA